MRKVQVGFLLLILVLFFRWIFADESPEGRVRSYGVNVEETREFSKYGEKLVNYKNYQPGRFLSSEDGQWVELNVRFVFEKGKCVEMYSWRSNALFLKDSETHKGEGGLIKIAGVTSSAASWVDTLSGWTFSQDEKELTIKGEVGADSFERVFTKDSPQN